MASFWGKLRADEASNPRYSEKLEEVRSAGTAANVLVHGHEHRPGILPLKSHPNPRYVIDTGCWRRVVRRVPGTNEFVGRQVYSLLWAEPDGQGNPVLRLERKEEVI